MDTQVFNLIRGINCEGFDNSTWDILHSNGDLRTSTEFSDVADKIMPEGDYICIWLKPDEYPDFIKEHKDLCWHVVTRHSYNPDYYIYIYKV